MIVFLENSIIVGWFHLCLNSGSVNNNETILFLLELLVEEGKGDF